MNILREGEFDAEDLRIERIQSKNGLRDWLICDLSISWHFICYYVHCDGIGDRCNGSSIRKIDFSYIFLYEKNNFKNTRTKS